MLLELTRWLEQLQDHFNLFNYLTFRAILGALTRWRCRCGGGRG